jgi:hypothetical protein
MAVYLDLPFEDETLFSVVGRYARDMQVGNWIQFCRHLYGCVPQLHTALARGLSQVADQTERCWGLTAADIAEQMTGYPYFAAFCTSPQRGELIRGMLAPPSRQGCGMFSFQTGTRTAIRYCEACFSDDRKARRPLYWRRSHQLPGVVICHIHDVILSELSFKRPCSGVRFPLPEERAGRGGAVLELHPTVAQLENWSRVARVSHWFLTHRVAVEIENFYDQFVSAARMLGYAMGNFMHTRVIADRLTEAFGEAYLRRAQLYGWPGTDTFTMFYPRHSETHRYPVSPLRRVLLGTFLMQESADPLSAWPVCPSAVAAHGADHPVPVRFFRDGRYTGFCDCGLVFGYSRMTGNRPENPKIVRYGWSYAAEVQRLSASGHSCCAISRMLSMSWYRAATLLRRPQEPHYLNTPISDLVRQWKSLVALRRSGAAATLSDPGLARKIEILAPDVFRSTRAMPDTAD